jgi:hypothetical protein
MLNPAGLRFQERKLYGRATQVNGSEKFLVHKKRECRLVISGAARPPVALQRYVRHEWGS